VKIAFGLKAHSGWAALVAVGESDGQLRVLDRRRLELVEPADASWAKQPYHAAEGLDASEARKVVERGVEASCRLALQELNGSVKRADDAGHQVAACAVLIGEPMPDWTIDEILAVHFRMHKAEGVLFREALVQAADACQIKAVQIPEKLLKKHAERALATPASALMDQLASLGRSVGPPWGKDQKEAALAALTALSACRAVQ